MAPRNRIRRTGVLAVLAVALAALLSGCAGLPGSAGDDGNRAPVARLDADRTTGWAGDEFTFDAQSSDDPDGEVAEWRFDFGDGTRANVTDEDAARVTHAYARGGEYRVTVTVVDDGTGDGLGEETDEASVAVAVDERVPVAATVVRTGLPNVTQGSSMAVPFDVRDGADRAVANLTLQNTLATGTSEVRVILRGAGGEALRDEAFTLSAGETRDVDVAADLDETGAHALELVAVAGAVRATGDQQVLYGEDFDEPWKDAGEAGDE